ncbi:hypothetical protein B9L23_03765 [Parageobacillus galactosidasius]|uniref:Uncharacterized protein n=1 Tax=Parageobacillus galactosidasius TaxID=883812 RepID=A0A226QPU8_9BACL|nr:hypothetical protein B9L23_03765 [Parageobacillus galactosidasius]
MHKTQQAEQLHHDEDKVFAPTEDLQRIEGGVWNQKSFRPDSREHPLEAHCFSCGRKAGFIFSVYIEFFVQYKYTGFRKVGESRMLCTLKIKLMPTLEQFHALLETMKRFNQACNYISEIAFRSRTFSKTKIQRL